MLRVGQITADPATAAEVKRIVEVLGGTVIDGLAFKEAASNSLTRDACDLVVFDVRPGNDTRDWLPTTARWTVPVLVLADADQADELRALLQPCPDHQLVLHAPGTDALPRALFAVVARGSAPPPSQTFQWGAYQFDAARRTVQFAAHAPKTLSPFKFNFAFALFMLRDRYLSFDEVHRQAWGRAWPARASVVAAHAAWAIDQLQLDGRHGYRLEIQPSAYCLHGPGARIEIDAEKDPAPHTKDVADTVF